MAGVSRQPFRVLCRELGAALATTELVPPEVLVTDSAVARRLLAFDPAVERPFSVQLHGLDEALMARAALVAVELGAQVLDLNMGNPVANAGTSLLLDPQRAGRMVALLRSVTHGRIPITVKTRAGVHSPREVFALAQAVEAAGCEAIVVHPRTTRAKYSGPVAWQLLTELKRTVSMRVIANGEVRTPDEARQVLNETRCDGVMIGRAALGNPWLFRRLLGGAAPGVVERERVLRRHWALHQTFYGHDALREFQPHLGWYARALSRDFLRLAARIDSDAALNDFLGVLAATEPLYEEPGLAPIGL